MNWKEFGRSVSGLIEEISLNSRRGAEENHEKHQSWQPFEPSTCEYE
jgi:hypothetical protein